MHDVVLRLHETGDFVVGFKIYFVNIMLFEHQRLQVFGPGYRSLYHSSCYVTKSVTYFYFNT